MFYVLCFMFIIMADTQLIKDKLDIVDFISEYVPLKRAGINYKACCPFHQEKTPSFMVNRERQSWHCFGCNKGGDIFTFLQEIEGMEFVEALKFLAEKAGVRLDYKISEINTSQKNRIKDINTEAARFFHNFLLKMDAARLAREYLRERGLSDNTIENWQIGFGPEQWDLLTQYLLKKGHSIDDLVAVGLTIKKAGADIQTQKGFYDRFRGRIMFPISDTYGAVVGFTGRVLVETEKSGGKYVNTPQTIVYDKSRVVFGLNYAKPEIKAKDLIVMVEGQMDVIACHQAGMKNVVATSGTALTEAQVRLLKRYSNNLNIAYDADAAGLAAAKRGVDIAIKEGMNVKVISIPTGLGNDPDEVCKKNKSAWFEAVAQAKGIMPWYFDKSFANKEMSDPKQKQMVADELLARIALIPYAVEQDHWLRELASRINVEVSVLREDLARISKISNSKFKIPNSNDEKIAIVQEKKLEKTRLILLTERLLALVLKFPNEAEIFRIDSKWLSTTPYVALYQELKERYNNGGVIDSNQLSENYNLLLLKGDLEFDGLSDKEARGEAEKLRSMLREEWRKSRRQELQRQIEKAEKAGDRDLLEKLSREFQELNT